MRLIFGPHTQRVLKFLADLWLLSPAEITKVTKAWKDASDLDRAEAWAQLHRAASGGEWDKIMAAASVARRQAMDAAYLLHRTDWAFWAAAWDAAAAIAGQEGLGSGYSVLTRPLAAVMPSLREDGDGARVPAQRAGTRAAGSRNGSRPGRATQGRAGKKTAQVRREAHPTGKK
jgi:hypothetical protein